MQFLEVGSVQRLVGSQLVNGDVVVMLAEETSGLVPESLEVVSGAEPWQVHGAFRAHFVLEVGVDRLLVTALDELDEIA